MYKATLLASLLLVTVASRAEQTLLPQHYFDLRGPCYPPDELRSRLQKAGFKLVATGRTLDVTELDAIIHFYRADSDFIIALTHADLICTVVLGEELNFGV